MGAFTTHCDNRSVMHPKTTLTQLREMKVAYAAKAASARSVFHIRDGVCLCQPRNIELNLRLGPSVPAFRLRRASRRSAISAGMASNAAWLTRRQTPSLRRAVNSRLSDGARPFAFGLQVRHRPEQP